MSPRIPYKGLFLTPSERICPSAEQATAIAVPEEIPAELLLLTKPTKNFSTGQTLCGNIVMVTIHLRCNSSC